MLTPGTRCTAIRSFNVHVTGWPSAKDRGARPDSTRAILSAGSAPDSIATRRDVSGASVRTKRGDDDPMRGAIFMGIFGGAVDAGHDAETAAGAAWGMGADKPISSFVRTISRETR